MIIGKSVGPNGFGRIGANNPFYDPLTNGGSDPANGQYDKFIEGDQFFNVFNGYGPTQATSEILPLDPQFLPPDPLVKPDPLVNSLGQGTDPLTGTLRSSDNSGNIFPPNNGWNL